VADVVDEASPREPSPALFVMSLTKVTSFLIVTQRSQQRSRGTPAQLRDAYAKALQHNLLFGWWGFPFGIIWTAMALSRNKKVLADVERLIEQRQGPGGSSS